MISFLLDPLFKNSKPVTIEVKNAELNDVLKKIFDEQELDYAIEDKSVVVSIKVSIKKPSLLERVVNRFSAIEVKGKVVDSGVALYRGLR